MKKTTEKRFNSSQLKIRKKCISVSLSVLGLLFGALLFISAASCNPPTGENEGIKSQALVSGNENTEQDLAPVNIDQGTLKDLNQDEYFPYDLSNPSEKYKLPNYLTEISGLSYCKKDKIACVQDEKANIYVLNLDKNEVVSKYDFGKDGDYEDIAIVDKTAYVIRNDGKIFRIKNFEKNDRKVKKIKTPLTDKNDSEGLTYDLLTNSLLIACKGSPSVDKEYPYHGYKAIYKFDLENNELVKTPHLLVDLENLDSYKDQRVFTQISKKLAKKIGLTESETSFQPSGIAIHPVFAEIYIISSVGKLLIILDRHGKVLDVRDLDPELFRQPEGICFSPSGDLFISNEGKGGKGYILQFNFIEDE